MTNEEPPTLPTRPLTVLVCDSDPVASVAHAKAAERLGFEVLDKVENAARAIQLLPFVKPSLVIMANELPGTSGVEALRPISELDDPPEAIILTTDPGIREAALHGGAFAVLDKGDVEALDRVILDARHLFETGERRTGADRRSGHDRREHQDWSKVTRERRAGEDRRHEDGRRT